MGMSKTCQSLSDTVCVFVKLQIPMFSGLDERGECRGCLSVGLFFKATADPAEGTLIQNGDCWGGTLWKIFIGSGFINWEAESKSTGGSPVRIHCCPE